MDKRYTSLILFIFLGLPYTLFGKEINKIEIIRPIKNDILSVDVASVVVKIKDRSIKKLKFISEEGDIFEKNVLMKRDTYCKNLKLVHGLNTIIVRAYTKKKKVADVMIEVFYKFPANRRSKYAPPRFKKNYFHKSRNEQICKKCHKMNINEVEGYAFEDVRDSNCYMCHKDMLENKKYAHAPTVNWLCGQCHSKEKSKYTKYPSFKNINKLCFGCHDEFRKDSKTKKYRHEPLITIGCIRCHDPHASEYKYFKRLPLNRLCTVCHGNKIRKIPKDGDKCGASIKGTCVDCHSPHFSNKKYMYEPNRHKELKNKQTTFE